MRFVNSKLFHLAAASTVVLGLTLLPGISSATTTATPTRTIVEFDVAEDGTRFVFDETPLHDDGLPAYGGEFITQGYLYPPGTLTCEDGICDGANRVGCTHCHIPAMKLNDRHFTEPNPYNPAGNLRPGDVHAVFRRGYDPRRLQAAAGKSAARWRVGKGLHRP